MNWTYEIGKKVICIDDQFYWLNNPFCIKNFENSRSAAGTHPYKGEIIVIDDIDERSKQMYLAFEKYGQVLFQAEFFRPVDSIEIISAALKSQHELV